MQEIAIFGDHQEDEAIDKAEELVEETVQAEIACGKPRTQFRVGVEKAGAEQAQGFLDTIAQTIARCLAFARAGIAPALQRRILGRARASETAAMDQQPERAEAGEVLIAEDLDKVSLDPGWACQAVIGAHQPEHVAIAGKPPEPAILAVQRLLQQAGGRMPALDREQITWPVKCIARRRDDNGDTLIPGDEHTSAQIKIIEAEDLLEKVDDQPLGRPCPGRIRSGKTLKERLADPEKTRQLLAKGKPGREAVLLVRLLAGFAPRNAGKDRRGNQRALEVQRLEIGKIKRCA